MPLFDILRFNEVSHENLKHQINIISLRVWVYCLWERLSAAN